VQTADDPDFITNVRTLFNNDIDNSLGLGVGKKNVEIRMRFRYNHFSSMKEYFWGIEYERSH
jgi:hypothetical protein